MSDAKIDLLLLELASLHAKLDELLCALPNAKKPAEPEHLSDATHDRLALRQSLYVGIQRASLTAMESGGLTEVEMRAAAEKHAAESRPSDAEIVERIRAAMKKT